MGASTGLVFMLASCLMLATTSVPLSPQPQQDAHTPRSRLANRGGPGGANCPSQPIPRPWPGGGDVPTAGIKQAFASLETFLATTLNTDTIPGLSAIVTYQDQVVWTSNQGVSDKSATPPRPLTSDTIYRIGSTTKIFPVLLMYQLYQQGLLGSLDDTVQKYASNFPFPGPTFRQLSSQLSGIARTTPCQGAATNTSQCALTSEQVYARLTPEFMIMPPYTMPSYSNLGFSILGHVLGEQVVGNSSFRTLVTDNIISALNMSNTGFVYTPSVRARMATGYDSTGQRAPLIDLGWPGPSGEMYASVDDLATLSIDIWKAWKGGSNGLGLSQGLARELLLPLWINNDQRSFFGTPWEGVIIDGYQIRSKSGNVPGYSTFFSLVPELGLSLHVAWTNGVVEQLGPITTMWSTLIPAFTSWLSSYQYPNIPQPPASQPVEQYIGSFIDNNMGVSAQVLSTSTTTTTTTSTSTSTPLTTSPLRIILNTPVVNLTTWLWWQGGDSFALYNTTEWSCLYSELIGFNFQRVDFQRDPNTQQVVALSLPTLLPGSNATCSGTQCPSAYKREGVDIRDRMPVSVRGKGTQGRQRKL